MPEAGQSRTAVLLAALLTFATLAVALQPLRLLLAACQHRLPGAVRACPGGVACVVIGEPCMVSGGCDRDRERHVAALCSVLRHGRRCRRPWLLPCKGNDTSDV